MGAAEPRFPARFDEPAWKQDLERSTQAGRAAATEARRRYRLSGIPRSELRPCAAEGRDGTQLPMCLKVYLPPPAGRFGMVFALKLIDNRITLVYLAFGVRHHPPESNALSVYQIAHRRL